MVIRLGAMVACGPGWAEAAGRGGHGGELLVQQPLQPRLVGDLGGVLGAEAADLGARRVAVGGRPGAPVVAVGLLQGAEGGELLQSGSGGAVGGQAGLAVGQPRQGQVAAAQGRVLQPVDGWPVDAGGGQQAATLRKTRLEGW
jgi:hypothetical protein